MTTISLPFLAPVTSRLRERRGLWSIYEEMARVLGESARDERNLVARPCPVCGDTEFERRPALTGPVYPFHRCRGCGMLYAPRLLAPGVVANRYGKTALRRAYLDHLHEDARATAGREVNAALLDHLGALVPSRRAAVDVGCGFGQLVAELASRFDEAVGLELDPDIASAAAGLHPRVEIRCTRLEALGRDEGTVDLVTMNQILEHIEEPGPILDAARRLLRPRGVLWVSVPHGGSLGLGLLAGRHKHVATHMHVNLFTAGTLQALLTRHGFHVETSSTDDDPGFSVIDLTRAQAPALLAAPAMVLDKGLSWLSSRARVASRLGRGAHLEITARKT